MFPSAALVKCIRYCCDPHVQLLSNASCRCIGKLHQWSMRADCHYVLCSVREHKVSRPGCCAMLCCFAGMFQCLVTSITTHRTLTRQVQDSTGCASAAAWAEQHTAHPAFGSAQAARLMHVLLS